MSDRIPRGKGSSHPRIAALGLAWALAACTSMAEGGRLAGVDEEEGAIDHEFEELGDALEEWDGYDDEEDADPAVSRCAQGVRPSEVVPVDPSADPETGQMRVRSGDTVVALPLAEVAFDTVVLGTIADTEVRQVFENPFETAIEAVYVFPLPHDAAVDDYAIEIGDRTIRGVMKRRDEARAVYERARADGQSAGLLEQERPNIFTQSVANIPPGERITVVMHMVGPVTQDRGRFELALPTVVGPRYVPGEPTGRSGGGFARDTDRVPDGSKITPRALPEGYVGCAELTVHVEIDAGPGIDRLAAKHHEVAVTEDGDRRFVELAKTGELPNRDFVLGWKLAGKAPRTSLVLGPDERDQYFQLTILPPRLEHAGKAEPRELVFVLDTSGSMAGEPLELSKAAMNGFLSGLGPHDAFQVIDFSDVASQLGDEPLRHTRANVSRARRHISAMDGSGGTEMLSGIRAALDFPYTDGRARYVLMLTDGYIGNESEIFAEVEKRRGPARVFALGVGGAPNRFLLDGLARAGRGAVVYVENPASPREAVATFYRRLAHPVLTDLEIEWGDLAVEDVVPARIPDLFAGQPVVVYGRMTGKRSGGATLVGHAGGERVEIPIRVDEAAARRTGGLASMWARRKIEQLEDARLRHPDRAAKLEDAVTALALEHRVMSAYTSFVAVDDSRVAVPGGGSERFYVPVEEIPSSRASYAFSEADEAPMLSGDIEDEDVLDGSPVVRRKARRREDSPSAVAEARLVRLVDRNRRALDRCFDAAAERDVVLHTLQLAVGIDTDGTILSVDFSLTPTETVLQRCIEREVRSWKVRHPGSGAMQVVVEVKPRT